MAVTLLIKELRAAPFSPFGTVIETAGHPAISINEGNAARFDRLADIDVQDTEGKPAISIFRARQWPAPIEIKMLERHPLGSQAFFPLTTTPFFVVVADVEMKKVLAFKTNGKQGVSFHRNTWHHPLLALEDGQEFLIVDRVGPGENCEESPLDPTYILEM